MSIVEFAEEILGYKLLSFQKEFLTKCDEAYASNKQLYYIPHNSTEPTKYEEASTRIVNVPDDVIKQIRIKTIEEFQHKLKKHYTKYNIDCVLEDTKFYSYPLACYYLEDYIDEIATELKSLDICDGEISPM